MNLSERLDGRVAAQQIQGARPYQEDDYGLIDPHDEDRSEVLLLADGMGGHVSGDTASRTIVRTFAELYPGTEGPIPDRLCICLDAANDALAAAIAENPGLSGMGSTVVAAVISPHGLDWISVGDSPLWLFREGELRRLNADHSMAPVLADLVAVGRMTEEEAATDSQRHALRSAVMGDDIHLVDVSSQPVAVRPSDRVVLASDGLMTLTDEQIAGILQERQEAPLAEVVTALIEAVEEAGHPRQDNTTVLLYTPAVDSEPATDSELAVDSEPTVDSESTADSEPVADSGPAADSEPVADSEPATDSEPETVPTSKPETAPTSETEPAPTNATPQAESKPRMALAFSSSKRGWLVGIACGFLLGLGLLVYWSLSGMSAEDVVVEPAPKPQEPAEQAGHQSPPPAFSPKDAPPPAQSDSVQTSGEGASSAGMAEPDQPPEAQAEPSLIPSPSQPDSGQASGEAPQEKVVKEDASPKPSAPLDTTTQ